MVLYASIHYSTENLGTIVLKRIPNNHNLPNTIASESLLKAHAGKSILRNLHSNGYGPGA